MDRYGQSYSSDSDEHSPVTWWRGYPIYAAHFIVIVYVASLFLTVLLNATGVVFHLDWLPFSSMLVLHGQVWRIFTFGLVNVPPPELRDLSFVFDMIYIAWFGREVERAVGRRTFLGMYAAIYLISPLVRTGLGALGLHSGLIGETGALAVFVAFATYFPSVGLFLNITAKWAAIILVGIYTLIAINYHDWASLIAGWATYAFAYAFVRHRQGIFELPDFKFWKRKPRLRVVPDLPAKSAKKVTAAGAVESGSASEIDALLDKIAQSGYASLTPKERARLESHSQSLKKNSGRN